MCSPNIIIKSGYITSHEHVINTLDYAGNKIAAQKIMFKDGSSLKVDADKKIFLSLEQQTDVSGIHVEYKDGGCKKISYATYKRLTEEAKETVTVDKLTGVEDDEVLLANENGKRYHKIEDLDFFKYLPYIEGRPGAEKSDGHGLFGLTGDISIEEARQTALEYKDSRKWSHIISLDADGAKRTGYDNREAWKNLIISKAPQIAVKYKINDLRNLVINCAFHSNTDNPHVHMIFYSKDKADGFIQGGTDGMNEASEALKSMFNNTIFKDDVATLTREKSIALKSVRKSMLQHVENINANDYSHTEINLKLHELADHMQAEKEENRSYGYLSAELKSEVSDILRQIVSSDNDMQGLFEKYLDSQRKIISQYVVDKKVLAAKMLDFENRFFVPDKKMKDSTWYHNKIVEAAKEIIKQEEQILSSPPAAAASRGRATKGINTDSAISTAPVSTDVYDSSQYYDEPQDSFAVTGEAPAPLGCRRSA